MTSSAFTRGIRENRVQVAHQLIQVMLVGFAIGMTRTVVPALAESEFGLERGSFLLLASFVVAFGAVKAVMNFIAGRWSERIGRKRVLFWGWVVALPIPVMIWYAPDWTWIVAATVLLGVNQGLCWSMTQTAKLDITKAEERGLTMGLNEFSGYVGVAIAGTRAAVQCVIARKAGGAVVIAWARPEIIPAGAGVGADRDGDLHMRDTAVIRACPRPWMPAFEKRSPRHDFPEGRVEIGLPRVSSGQKPPVRTLRKPWRPR